MPEAVDPATARSRRRFARRQWRRRWLAWRYGVVLVLVLALLATGVYAVWFSSWLDVEGVENAVHVPQRRWPAVDGWVQQGPGRPAI